MFRDAFNEGEVIYREGDACDTAFVILSGEVELKHNGTARLVTSGGMFGDVSLIQAEPYGETATALSAVKLRTLSESQVETLVYESPPEIQKIIENFSRQAPADTSYSHAHVTMSPDILSADKETVLDMLMEKRASMEALQKRNAPAGNPFESMMKVVEGFDRVTKLLEARCDNLEKKLQQHSVPAAARTVNEDSEALAPFELSQELTKQLSNLGPLMPLLNDDTVNDILINGAKDIYVERGGLLEKTDVTFPSDSDVFMVADKIVKAVGRKLDGKRPLVDARLLDGSRVNIIAPPLAVDGTTISIRKFSKKKITLDIMRDQENTNPSLTEFLKVIGRCRINVVISGGTGSGKTTLLNAVSQFIDPAERIVTIEDAAELQLQQPHVVRLETKPHQAGMTEEDAVSMRDLVKNALRMRPDRIIVGEVRGPEAFDMLQAMNTGHEGSLTTIHANHPRDALSRLENMISMADLQIPMKSLRYQIASALHLIIQVSRMRDGKRRVTFVSEVVGMEGDMITMHDLFNFVTEGEDQHGKVLGHFKWSGIMPRFIRRVAYYGELPRLEAALGVKMPKNF